MSRPTVRPETVAFSVAEKITSVAVSEEAQVGKRTLFHGETSLVVTGNAEHVSLPIVAGRDTGDFLRFFRR